jgi:NDP-sugar pyrophosphorylase family protein
MRDAPEYRHEELTTQDDHHHPRRCETEVDQRDERGRHEQLVRQRIHPLPQPSDLFPAPREIAVEPVRQRRYCKDQRAKNLFAHAKERQVLRIGHEDDDQQGTRKMRPSVIAFGRFTGVLGRHSSARAVSSQRRVLRCPVVMRAILLAGGKGSRLRPLTLHTPKPIVPIFDRPFLQYQIDLLRQVPEIDEVVLSLNYQPRRIEEVFGDGSDFGISVRYVVEPTPLGTGGAIKFAAGDARKEPIVVFNGDVFTSVDLTAVLALHRQRQAKATIVLTSVDNPTAYGLVETDAQGNVERFVEKPEPGQIRCDTINAGIYVLEPDTLDRIPAETVYSIERGYFPSLVQNRETFVAYIYRGYWIDIGTPEKYRQAHRDIMSGQFVAPPFAGAPNSAHVSPDARLRTARSSKVPASSTPVRS